MNSLIPYIKEDDEHLKPKIVSDSHIEKHESDEKFSQEFSKQVRNSVIEMNKFFKIANIKTDL